MDTKADRRAVLRDMLTRIDVLDATLIAKLTTLTGLPVEEVRYLTNQEKERRDDRPS
jgi:hypothetical protein